MMGSISEYTLGIAIKVCRLEAQYFRPDSITVLSAAILVTL